MKWPEDKTLLAADEASTLSALLNHDDLFKENAIRWLKSSHIEKFAKAIDAHEANNLKNFAEAWTYKNKENTSGFPLLDWLWVLGPSYESFRKDLQTSYIAGKGRRLISLLARFEPSWIGQWWKWCSKSGFDSNDCTLNRILVLALNKDDITFNYDKLDEKTVGYIIRKRPELLDHLPHKRWGRILAIVTNDDSNLRNLVTELCSLAIPSNSSAIVNSIINSTQEQNKDPLVLMNTIIENWQGVTGSDPVARVLVNGHDHLETIIRSFWDTCHHPSKNKSDALWDDPLNWSAPKAVASAVQVIPSSFCLEIGYSIGRRIAEDGQEPIISEVVNRLQKVGINTEPSLIEAILPMVELWATIRTLAIYEGRSWEHKTELVGLKAKVASLAASSPHLWAQESSPDKVDTCYAMLHSYSSGER